MLTPLINHVSSGNQFASHAVHRTLAVNSHGRCWQAKVIAQPLAAGHIVSRGSVCEQNGTLHFRKFAQHFLQVMMDRSW